MHYNGDSIPFLERLAQLGRSSALDDMPQLDEDGSELWRLYCFMGDDILLGMDVYERRIGLPFGWEFDEYVLLVAKLQKKKRELIKVDKQNDR